MNAKRFKSMIHARKVNILVIKQVIDDNGQTHIYGYFRNPKK